MWALDEGHPTARAVAAQASWWCGEVADEAAGFSLHVHGGYGFMLEYDVQLHVRRAKATRLLLGDPRHELQRIAAHRWGDAAPEPAAVVAAATARPTRAGMDFRFDPETEAFRSEVRAFIAEHLDDEIVARAHATGTMHDWGFHQALCARGYLAAGWPTEVGGLGRSAIDQCLLAQELYRSGAPIDGLSIAAMVGATLLICGTDEQKADVVPRILAGEVMCCLGYSEPDAGSDVAAVATRAVRDGDHWVIDGQKMFTTMAHEAHYVFLLARSNPDAPKHKGLTMFLVPMDTPGIEITPVETMGGERTNITFYNDVRVPDSARVGDVDAGWSVMHAALVYERTSANWGEPHRPGGVGRRVVAGGRGRRAPPLRRPRRAGRPRPGHHRARGRAPPAVPGRLAVLARRDAPGRGLHGQAAHHRGLRPGVRRPPRGARHRRRAGPPGSPEPSSTAWWSTPFRHSVVTTIYGGSSEVQREIVAGRGLGPPPQSLTYRI